MASSSHLKEEAGSNADFLRILEKAPEGRSDEEDEVASVALVGGGGSVARGCVAGVSCVEAVEMRGGGRGRGDSGSGCLVFGDIKVFGGEPRKVWVFLGDFLCLPFPVLRGGGGDFWSLFWAFELEILGSLGLPVDFLLLRVPVPFTSLCAVFFFFAASLSTFLMAGDFSGVGEGEKSGEGTL